MREKLQRLIKEEDKKNPLTDEQLAKLLYLNRSEVTQLRQSLGIPDSRVRRKDLLIEEFLKIIRRNPSISDRTLTNELNKAGFSISRYSVAKVYKEIGPDAQREVQSSQEGERKTTETPYYVQTDPFSNMIGWDKSLRVKVEQAKAAILYPPNGLHTLIVGATGVGKSEMAESMYKFALQVKMTEPNNFPFIVFNCADYSENPQLLLAQLFGYRKGAFTGAETDKDGLVAKANGGILFLDEVHRLPPDGQEILFQLIDKGKYRKLGETNIIHEAKVMIIAATSEDIEKNLLATFRRRIPMVIELSSLSMRPVEERLEIIKMFFQQEAARINKKIVVNYNTLRTLLIYNCIGNIGQLRSDIQVACARGFLNHVAKSNNQDSIIIDFGTLPIHVTKGLLDTKWNREEIEKYINDDLVFLPNALEPEEMKESLYTFPNEIYKNIEEEYQKLQKQGLADDVINRIIGEDLDAKVKKVIRQIEVNKHKLMAQDLKNIIRPEIVDLVQEMIKVASAGLGEIDDTLLYCLATHLNASVERIKSGKRINNPHMESVIKEYPKEYKVAKEMASLTNFYLGCDLPEEEIGFIAMYLRTLASKKSNPKETVGIVVVSHGHVAEGMASVANRLLGVDLVKAVEMSLDEKPEEAYARTLEAVLKADRGKGVLLLVDMGSLAGFGNQITQKTGIYTRTVTRVDTLMVIDAIRKVLLPQADLNAIADSLIKGRSVKASPYEDVLYTTPDKFAVISLCLTGEGTARHIENIIREKIHEIDKNIKIITLGVLDEKDIIEQIDKIGESMNILAIVGTVNPRHPEIPFFSAVEVLKHKGLASLREIVKQRFEEKQHSVIIKDTIFNKGLILLNKKPKDKNEALHMLAAHLEEKGYVTPNFINGVMEREKFGTTAVNDILAIPHSADDEIIKPGVGIMTLAKPIAWDEARSISLILMMAVNERSSHEFKRVFRIIKNQEITNKIRQCKTAEAIMEIISTV